MTNEIATQQFLELTNAKQEIEILKLKFELQKIQAEKVSRLDDSLFSPSLMPHYQKVSETLAKSSIIPTAYKNKPEDIFVAISMGYQLGFPVEQSLQDIAVINGRPCIWGDGLLALIIRHPDCISINEAPIYVGKIVTGFVCTVHRKGHEPHSQTFTIDDAKKAGLLNKQGPWSNYTNRMLQMRARSWALRDKFADALRGLKMAEEIQDENITVDAEIVQEKKQQTNVEKLKELLQESDKNVKDDSFVNDNDLMTVEQDEEITELIFLKDFNQTRIEKALSYYKIKSLAQLTKIQADDFIRSLNRISVEKKDNGQTIDTELA